MPTLSLSPKQLKAFQDSTARMNFLVGAVRSGKSFAANWALIRMCHEAPPGNLIIVGRSMDTVKRNIIDELMNPDLFPGINIHYYPGKRELHLEGRIVYTLGASDERAEARIRGLTVSGALIDEATLIPESFFRMLLSRLSRAGSYLIATTNPDAPTHYLKKQFIDRADELDMKVFNFTMEDNPSLTKDYIENLKKEYKGLWYKRFIQGQWTLAEGTIYDFFSEDIHVIPRPPSYAKFYLCALDYGTTNPMAMLLIGVNDEAPVKLWVEKEYYFDSSKEGYQKTDAEYADDLIDFISDYPVKQVIIDPSAASFKLEVRRRNRPFAIIDAKNDVLNGIRTVSTHLAVGNLKIVASCRNLIDEFSSYVWDSKKSIRGMDEPVKSSDHALDALRYGIFTYFGEKREIKELTNEQREIEQWRRMQQKMSPWATPKGQGRMQIIRSK